MAKTYIPIIGLEVHIELSTNSKLFCGCPADHFGKLPNTQVCPVCLGLPGALPFVNKTAIDSTIHFGLALNCKINPFSKFDRKHYFYPDLPKGYQISQYDLPLCFEGEFGDFKIRRIHLEEDTAKMQHSLVDNKKVSLVDFNRSSVPLMELVTEPVINANIDEVIEFLRELQRIVRYLGISNADMEKGSMRLEANISVSPDRKLPDYKVELKNINSFGFVKKALEYEIKRQTEALEKGEKIHQETRGFNEKTNKTVLQRVKEEAKDYRYFPEPDLPPLEISEDQISSLKFAMRELPEQKREKFRKLNLPENYIEVLVDDKKLTEFFETSLSLGLSLKLNAKLIASAIINQKLHLTFDTPEKLVRKLYESTQKTYASKEEVSDAIKKIITENPDALEKYKNGKTEIVGFLIGQVQRELKGQGEPKMITKILIEYLQYGK